MNKVLLIDDESYILELMCHIIPWDFYGFEIVGTVENAVDAMKIFHREQPQLIITDICMENISGIEFITRVRMQSSEVKIIILSAYDKFEYAQKALKLDVDGYLLKPINKDELLSALLDVQKKLEHKNTYQEQIVSLQNSLDHFQKKYLEGQLLAIYKEELKVLPKELEIPGFWCVLSIAAIVRSEIVFLEREIAAYSKITSFVLFAEDGMFGVILHGTPNAAEEMDEVRRIVNQKYCTEEKVMICGVGSSKSMTLPELCQSSKEALNWIFYEENHYYCDLISRKRQFIDREPKMLDTEQLLLLFVNRETKKSIGHFEQYLQECLSANVKKEKVLAYFTKCVGLMKSCIKEDDVLCRMEEELRRASESLWAQELRDSFARCVNLTENRTASFHRAGVVIANAQEYIKNQCFDEHFSIETVADYLRISKSYLSKLYKEETQESLWNFVIRVRITRAKEMLLHTDATNFTIAKAIGYSSEYHFSRAFSKLVGVSPSAYKKMYMQIK